jgi:transcription-repair coupling factor
MSLLDIVSELPVPQGSVGGVPPAGQAFVIAAAAKRAPGAVLCLTASRAEAERLVEDLQEVLGETRRCLLFPEAEMSVFDRGESDPDRIRVLHELLMDSPVVVVAPLLAFLQGVPAPGGLRRQALQVGQTVDAEKLLQLLLSWEYASSDLVAVPGQVARRGRVMDIFPSNGEPLRLLFEGDTVRGLRSFSPETQRTLQDLETVDILPMIEPEGKEALTSYLPPKAWLILVEEQDLAERLSRMAQAADSAWRFGAYKDVELLQDDEPDDWKQLQATWKGHPLLRLTAGKAHTRLDFQALPQLGSLGELAEWASERPSRLVVVTNHPRRLRNILTRRKVEDAEILEGSFSQGFSLPTVDLLTDRELFGTTQRYRPRRRPTVASLGDEFGEGDLVVHAERGIGRFQGLVPVELAGAKRDLLKLEYANEHTLMVPPEQISQLSAYRAGEADEPSLSRLDTGAWQKTLGKARESVQQTAQSLLAQRLERMRRKAPAMGADSSAQEELEAGFPYDETPSQLAAIADIKGDLEGSVAMDRLLCGDVGYGKTEVALRAAFKVLSHGFQAALLAPTTVLAQQHYESFRSRMEPLGYAVRGLWAGCDEAEQIVGGILSGELPMVVGTHSLLSEGIGFSKLGLLIIDEEQSFGVAHKETLRQLSQGVHVLSMSATPIPRTMQLALAGVRDISLLDAPPRSRRPIRTYLLTEEKKLLAAALMRELERGGQAFVLHNRVEELPELARTVARLVKGARVAVAHGQMEAGALEAVLQELDRREHDVLVCSTIIEAGIDYPNVNTIVIKDAHMFGLSQLYQIRGRVGRSGRQAYCYLMVPKAEELSEKARLRLQTITRLTDLGSGYEVALRDLEIRGAGNLLGGEQSGQIARLGYALYAQLLEQALGKDGGGQQAPGVAVDLPLDAHLPPEYIPATSLRIGLYLRLARLSKASRVQDLGEELADRFGTPPAPVLTLLDLARLRLLAAGRGYTAVRLVEQFGERSVLCERGDSDPLSLPRAPKGDDLLPFIMKGLEEA